MAKANSNDMIMAWLDTKIHENPDSFDAINAENCLALIRKQKKQLVRLGAHFCNLKKQRDKLRNELYNERITRALTNSDCAYPPSSPCAPSPWWEINGYSLRTTCNLMDENGE